MPDYIAQYRIYLEQEKHASANTVSSYIRDVTQFCAWLPEGSDLRRVKPAAVSDYLTYLTDRGRSATGTWRRSRSLRARSSRSTTATAWTPSSTSCRGSGERTRTSPPRRSGWRSS